MKYRCGLFFVFAFFSAMPAQAEDGLALTWKTDSGRWKGCGPLQCVSTSYDSEEEVLKMVMSSARQSASYDGKYGKCNQYTVSDVEPYDNSAEKVEKLSNCN
jgi:hypothetical protein